MPETESRSSLLHRWVNGDTVDIVPVTSKNSEDITGSPISAPKYIESPDSVSPRIVPTGKVFLAQKMIRPG